MRITAGTARGIPIKAPKTDHTRPATDSLRQALFSSLGQAIENAQVLDLFAGTGAYGLEALSRGASHASFVEKHRPTLQLLTQNLEAVAKALQSEPKQIAKTHCADISKPLHSLEPSSFDITIADPPYEFTRQSAIKVLELGTQFTRPGGLFILEFPSDLTLPKHPELSPQRNWLPSGHNKPALQIFLYNKKATL